LELRPNADHGILIHEVSSSHNDAPHSVEILWTSDQLTTQNLQQTIIHAPAGFEPAIPAGQQPQTYGLDS